MGYELKENGRKARSWWSQFKCEGDKKRSFGFQLSRAQPGAHILILISLNLVQQR